jgi:hypothetical protein
MDYRDNPQHRVPHHIKWSGFAPPKRSNFSPPLTVGAFFRTIRLLANGMNVLRNKDMPKPSTD